MQKAIALLLGILIAATWSVAAPLDSLSSTKARYPNSLIGEDFEILSEADLAANTCDVRPQPFSLGSDSLYWRCFKSKAVTFSCDSNSTADPNEGMMGLIVLNVNDTNNRHEYIARRPWPITDCHEFERTFTAAIKGTQHVCISGSSPRKSTDPNEPKAITWIFEKYKTSKGCDSYFEGACDLAYQIKHGCKVVQATQ